MLENFVLGVCGCERLWTSESIIEDAVARIKEQVGDDEVILGLSGGVDSSVVAMLVHRAIGDKLTCVFVDNDRQTDRQTDETLNSIFSNQTTPYHTSPITHCVKY